MTFRRFAFCLALSLTGLPAVQAHPAKSPVELPSIQPQPIPTPAAKAIEILDAEHARRDIFSPTGTLPTEPTHQQHHITDAQLLECAWRAGGATPEIMKLVASDDAEWEKLQKFAPVSDTIPLVRLTQLRELMKKGVFTEIYFDADVELTWVWGMRDGVPFVERHKRVHTRQLAYRFDLGDGYVVYVLAKCFNLTMATRLEASVDVPAELPSTITCAPSEQIACIGETAVVRFAIEGPLSYVLPELTVIDENSNKKRGKPVLASEVEITSGKPGLFSVRGCIPSGLTENLQCTLCSVGFENDEDLPPGLQEPPSEPHDTSDNGGRKWYEFCVPKKWGDLWRPVICGAAGFGGGKKLADLRKEKAKQTPVVPFKPPRR